jgi:hypothetical protein
MSGKYIKLTADIDLSQLPDYNVGAGWTPIGNYSTTSIYFAGSFDGGGFTVSNLYINITSATANAYVGLFGYIGSAGAISNLGLSGSATVVTASYSVRNYVGGIAGYVTGIITTSYSAVAVNTSSYIGVCVGGIAGYVTDGSITNCYNTGAVSALTRGYVGGIVGYVDSGGTNYINNSYNTGAVSATADGGTGSSATAGGIVGSSVVGCNMTSCYNTGAVSSANSGNGSEYAGGIAGLADSSITNCYNTGAVSATGNAIYTYVGGIAGQNRGSITTSYYNKDNFGGSGVGYDSSLSSAGLTTAQMTAADALTTMSGLGANFTKRANGNDVLYYPELTVFKNSTNPAVEAASRISVSITSVQHNPLYAINYHLDGGTNNANNPDSYSMESTAITLYDATRNGIRSAGGIRTPSLPRR